MRTSMQETGAALAKQHTLRCGVICDGQPCANPVPHAAAYCSECREALMRVLGTMAGDLVLGELEEALRA